MPDIEDAADELVQKFAVVGNHQHPAGVALEILLEPEQRLEVEVVRRLVEHEQVRLLREQSRQVRAHDPAAGHLARGPVEVRVAEAQALENLLRAGLDLIAIQLVEAVVNVVMRVNVVRVGRLPRLELAAHLDEVRRDGGGQLDDGFIPGGRALLRQVAQRDAALEIDLPIIRRVGLEDEREERGLARAVRSD